MKKQALIVGGGGHAKVLIEILILKKYPIAGYADQQDKGSIRLLNKTIRYLGTDEIVAQRFSASKYVLVNGIGSTKEMTARCRIYEKFKQKGYDFLTVIHPQAILSKSAVIGEGTQIMAGAVIQPLVQIGRNCIINTRASIDHEGMIQDHVHIAPGAVLSGGVTVGEGTHVGVGAVIIQGVKIGKNLLVRARSLTVRSVLDKKDAEVISL